MRTGSRSGRHLQSAHTEEESRYCPGGKGIQNIQITAVQFRYTGWVREGDRYSVRQVKWVSSRFGITQIIPITQQNSFISHLIQKTPQCRIAKYRPHTYLASALMIYLRGGHRSHNHTDHHDQLQKWPLTEIIVSTWTIFSRWRKEPLDVIHWMVTKCLDNWITGFPISMATAEHLQLCYTEDTTWCLWV